MVYIRSELLEGVFCNVYLRPVLIKGGLVFCIRFAIQGLGSKALFAFKGLGWFVSGLASPPGDALVSVFLRPGRLLTERSGVFYVFVQRMCSGKALYGR